jgi:predicted nuclease of predicted toxin-antitoxin system
MPNVFIAPGSPFSVYNSKMENISDSQVEKLLRGLSLKQVQSLLLLLQGRHRLNTQKLEPIKEGSKASL